MTIVKVNKDNYAMFEEMVFFRINERDKNAEELKEAQDFSEAYETLENTNIYVYAAKLANKFIGWIAIVYIPKIKPNCNGYLYIDELWVHPNYRKKGIAAALMKKADMICQEMNISGLRLYVGTTNEAGILLYTKCGYESKFGEALLMEKDG
jgi:ribosomal protein S18 acetylase RimI-like enzyme